MPPKAKPTPMNESLEPFRRLSEEEKERALRQLVELKRQGLLRQARVQ